MRMIALLLMAPAVIWADASYRHGATPERVLAFEPQGVTASVSRDFEVQDGVGVILVRNGADLVARLVAPRFAAKIFGGDHQITAGDAWLSAPSQTGRLLSSSARRILYEVVPRSVWFGRDQLGSVTLEADERGVVVGRRQYTPFGVVRASRGDGDRHGFTSQAADAGGLLHFPFRVLDPGMGRWTAPDPLFAASHESALTALGESATSYAYVANNPVGLIDPTGLMRRKPPQVKKANENLTVIDNQVGSYNGLRIAVVRDPRGKAKALFQPHIFRDDGSWHRFLGVDEPRPGQPWTGGSFLLAEFKKDWGPWPVALPSKPQIVNLSTPKAVNDWLKAQGVKVMRARTNKYSDAVQKFGNQVNAASFDSESSSTSNATAF